MSTEPSIEVRDEQPYVAFPATATFREWGRVNALVGEIFGWLGQRGIPPAGPLFYRYRVQGDAERPFQLEVLPVINTQGSRGVTRACDTNAP